MAILPGAFRRMALALATVIAAAAPTAADAQIFHRPRCSNPSCPDAVFRVELERMTVTEGALASDRDHADLRELKQRIELELARAPEDATLWLALSEVELGLGDPAPAIAAARRALELGADSVLALRQQGAARMRMTGGEADGAELYLEALGRMTRASAPRFLADYLPMLTPEEYDWWRSTDLETLRAWARDYWEHRAALAGIGARDRLVEHMRRMATAARLYAPPGTGSGAVGDNDVLRLPALRVLPYDDRGLVYIRRGPPHEELRVPSDIFSGLPATTWLYAGVEGSVDAFHFARGLSSGSGFRLVVAPSCDPNYVGSGTGVTPATVADGWVLTGAGISTDATRAAVSCFSGDAWSRYANASLNEIALRRETVRALAVESPRAPFDTALPAFFDFFSFRRADGATEVVTPVVIPVEPGTRQPVDLLVTFADRTGGVVRREATSASVRTEAQASVRSGGETWGVAYITTAVRPSDNATFRIVVTDATDASRGGMWGGAVRVRSFDSYGPKMSDVILSGPGPGIWSRGDTRLFLLPARSFVPGATASIFYELYDLEPGTTYRTELTVSREDEGVGQRLWRALTGAGEIRVAFESRVPENAGSTLQELRSLGLPRDEGRFTLTVRVTNAAGQSTEATRSVIISQDAAEPEGETGGPRASEPREGR